ncbi:hypothetical protein ASPZODRAFT_17790 [Penicilliopsis zonata CBS 506.65]|uniref:MIND kinetochore complex component Nnf1 n=1 Tax=Penicilliopsis zonata CBS 506.65 TaxID=1073090 RepID=A0A1L9SCJ3_9EURO|nr:hypothetical protein ASPZODRAFT_17790 [Penicilliopsis zonata CBS 506.65]OJJ44874.1 hypothetical protein ASPZODRAFT_17790 [Penicilliopsis zonata CBS 506.65]
MSESQAHPGGPSPSPPPRPPVALTPGPRAARLQQVFDQALKRTLRANSFANFSSCFPTPATYVPASLESVWRQLNAKLEESASAEFQDIIAERDAVRQLNELDRLVGEARLRKENDAQNAIAPHTLGAEELYQAHLIPYFKEVEAELNTKLETTQDENTKLAARIQAQRMEIQGLLSNLETVVADLDHAATAAAQFSDQHHLRQEAADMDAEVKAMED